MVDFLLLEWLEKPGADRFLISSELLLLSWHRVFGMIVFLGVAGEMIADAGVFISSARLQEIQEEEVAEAKTNASTANVRASKIEKEAAELKAANLALEAQIAPRRLNANQLASLVALFEKFPNRAIRVASYELDVEAYWLGHQLLAAADAAKLSVQDRRMSQGALGGMTVGVSVTGTDADLVNGLLSLFVSFGLAPTPNEPPPTGGASFGGQGAPFPAKIFVGAKPLAK